MNKDRVNRQEPIGHNLKAHLLEERQHFWGTSSRRNVNPGHDGSQRLSKISVRNSIVNLTVTLALGSPQIYSLNEFTA
jgi:hypothetical protein